MQKGKVVKSMTPFKSPTTERSATGGWLGQFWADQSGNMSFLAAIGATIMMVFGGIGIDMIHAELKRNKLQNTLDRAVLAAADLDNAADAEATVNEYFAAMGLSDALINVDVDEGLNYKTVTAEGYSTHDANFMQLLGVDTLQSGGIATAEERIGNVEISMVLDISGSMAWGNKMGQLQTAAKEFVDTVMNEDNDGLVSISLVPYSEHVNAGPEITQHLDVDWMHNYSHCLEFPDDEFDNVNLNTAITYEQMQHFQWNYTGSNALTDTVCPRYDYERIQPFSGSATSLKDQIDQLQPRAGTSIFMGMKWGAALLDPSTNMVASGLAGTNGVPASFGSRPAAYSDENTLKTVVLMTDGKHDKSFRINTWAYDRPAEYAHWNRYNLWYYLAHYVYWPYRGSFYTQKYNAGLGDNLLGDICDAAKDQGIVIWSIGFEVDDHGANVMQQCASSPAHFFRVEGVEISEAFESIASTINQLRLTQ